MWLHPPLPNARSISIWSKFKMGGHICAVKDCKNATSSTRKVSFFRFPKDLRRTEQWLKFCGRCIKTPLEKLYSNYRICGEHFISSMFLNDLKNRLQPYAVPTINLSANLESSPEVSRMPTQDAVINCPSIEDKNKKLFLENVAMQQIKMIGRTNLISNKSSAINEIHSADFSSTKKRLKIDVMQNVTSAIDTHKPNNHRISIKYVINNTYYPQKTEETDTRKEKTDTKRKAEEASIKQEEIEETSQQNNGENSTAQLKIQKLEEENTKLKELIRCFQEKEKNDLKIQVSRLNAIIQENQMEFQQKLALKNKELKLLRMKLKRKDDIMYKLLTTARTE